MRSRTHLHSFELTQESLESFFDECEITTYIQDMIHIGTKLRNRILKLALVLPMGKKLVAVTHIKMLLGSASKEIHGLIYNDVCPQDRQNYASLEKIMRPRVIQSLEQYVTDSEATVEYLKMCKLVTSSFLDRDLEPIERVYRLWKAVYFLRAWRKWLKKPENIYNIDENFISANAYTCIEINAHGLIQLIQRLRDSSKSELFIPNLFASQPCEHVFRQMRSMGTANYTKINFSLFELLHLVSRVDLMNEIVMSRLKNENVSFPRSNLFGESSPVKLPTDEEILIEIKKAQIDGIKSAVNLGMEIAPSDVTKCELKKNVHIGFEARFEEQLGEEAREEEEDLEAICPATSSGESSLRSKFIDVIQEDGTIKSVSKSELIWVLSETKYKLSSDRLQRVQDSSRATLRDSSNQNMKRRRIDTSDVLSKLDEIQIGILISV